MRETKYPEVKNLKVGESLAYDRADVGHLPTFRNSISGLGKRTGIRLSVREEGSKIVVSRYAAALRDALEPMAFEMSKTLAPDNVETQRALKACMLAAGAAFLKSRDL